MKIFERRFKMKPLEQAIREAVGRARDRLVARLRSDDLAPLASGEEIFIKLIEATAQIARNAEGAPLPSIVGPLQGAYHTLLEVVDMLHGTVAGIEAEKSALEVERNEALQATDRAQEECLAEIRKRDHDLERAEAERRELSRLVMAGGDRILIALRELVTRSLTTLDDLLLRGESITDRLQTIVRDAGRELPSLQTNVLRLEERSGELSAKTAPLLANFETLEASDLATISAVVEELDAFHRDHASLNGLLDSLLTEYRRAGADVIAWERDWLEVRKVLLAAETLIPLVTSENVFSFAGTTQAAVELKRSHCGDLSVKIKRGASQAEKILGLRQEQLSLSLARTAARREELEQLRCVLAMPIYEALGPEERELIPSLVLAFGDKNDRLSIKRLKLVLVGAGLIHDDGETSRLVDRLLTAEHFCSSGGEQFKLSALTARGHYWHGRWRRERTDLLELIEQGHRFALEQAEAVEEERSRRRVTREAERAESQRREEEGRAQRTAEKGRLAEERRARQLAEEEAARRIREAREAERRNPILIRGELTDLQREILQALMLRPVLPAARDASTWTRVLVAAWSTRLVSTDAKNQLARSLVKLIMFEPPLFEPRKVDGQLGLIFSETGQAVYRLLFTPPPQRIHEFEEMLGRDIRLWDTRSLALRKQLERAMIEAMSDIPADRYRL